jgi:hypothetical protein
MITHDMIQSVAKFLLPGLFVYDVQQGNHCVDGSRCIKFLIFLFFLRQRAKMCEL